MSATDSEVAIKVGQWVHHAEEDLRLARHALTLTSGCPYRLVAYHAQQCAEKYLKAFLVSARVDFPYTHNISRLLELCEPLAPWSAQLTAAEELTPFAITTRYPGIDTEVSRDEALEAIEIAAVTRDTILEALRSVGTAIDDIK